MVHARLVRAFFIAARDALLTKLRDKRRRIAAFNDGVAPRGAYLTNIGIVASAVATLLTAGPAIEAAFIPSELAPRRRFGRLCPKEGVAGQGRRQPRGDGLHRALVSQET
jgi:hypothetical protein